MSGALSQVWGMINGLQIFVHLPLFEISMPANAGMFVSEMTQIATFDIIENRDLFDGWLLDFPEEDEGELKGRFVETGYENKDIISLLGIGFVIIVILLIVMFFLCITNPCKEHSECLERINEKASGIIFWNFWLRFLIEDSLCAEISLCCYLFSSNLARDTSVTSEVGPLRELESNSPGFGIYANDDQVDTTFLYVNNSFAVILACVFLSLPIFIALFYVWNFHKLANRDFEA